MDVKNDLLPVINALTPLIFVASAYFAFHALKASRQNIKESVNINKRNKRADTILHCNNRYDELYKLRISIQDMPVSAQTNASRSYYARFWGLKSDQFDYWLAGLIDIHTFFDWASSTLRSFRDGKRLIVDDPRSSFFAGWEDVGSKDNEIPNPWFTELIQALIELSASDGMERSLFDELLEILSIVDKKSKPYRLELQDDMSIAFYVKTRKDLPRLGLSKAERRAVVGM